MGPRGLDTGIIVKLLVATKVRRESFQMQGSNKNAFAFFAFLLIWRRRRECIFWQVRIFWFPAVGSGGDFMDFPARSAGDFLGILRILQENQAFHAFWSILSRIFVMEFRAFFLHFFDIRSGVHFFDLHFF